MPNLPMHIYLAHQVVEQLDWGYVHDHLGSCLLGSTTPDIRAMTKWPREYTHFAPLSVESVGTGTRLMFEAYPELADFQKLSPETRSFILGYISHLAADEVWITTMFRPYFDDHNSVTDSEVEAHIWDRALQLDLDHNAHRELGTRCQPSEVMAMAEKGVDLPLVPPKALLEWREWACRFMGWEFSWDRLKRVMNRVYRDNDEVQMQVDHFLQAMPDSLERIYAKIPEEKLVIYQQQALDETLAQAREYLSGI